MIWFNAHTRVFNFSFHSHLSMVSSLLKAWPSVISKTLTLCSFRMCKMRPTPKRTTFSRKAVLLIIFHYLCYTKMILWSGKNKRWWKDDEINNEKRPRAKERRIKKKKMYGENCRKIEFMVCEFRTKWITQKSFYFSVFFCFSLLNVCLCVQLKLCWLQKMRTVRMGKREMIKTGTNTAFIHFIFIVLLSFHIDTKILCFCMCS